jgi:hypothetical protein
MISHNIKAISYEHSTEYHQVRLPIEPLYTTPYILFKCIQYTKFLVQHTTILLDL